MQASERDNMPESQIAHNVQCHLGVSMQMLFAHFSDLRAFAQICAIVPGFCAQIAGAQRH